LWTLVMVGGLLVLASFMIDFRVVLLRLEPPPFRWGLFGAGVTLGLVALVHALRKRA
jgi:hypothetical protein